MELRQDVSGWMVRWNEETARAARADGSWPDRTVADFARAHAAAAPDRIRLIDGGRAFTSAELVQMAEALAGFFRMRGLKPGDAVSFQLPNWWEANVINLAAAMTGVVLHPIVPIFREAEVGYMLADCGSRMVFVPRDYRRFNYLHMMRRVNKTLARPVEIIIVRGLDTPDEISFEKALRLGDGAHAQPRIDPDAVKLCIYTSGTTGRPKGVLHTHNTIHGENFKTAAFMGATPKDTMFLASPVTHVTGALYVLNFLWYADITMVVLDTWDPDVAYDLLAKHDCTLTAGATPFLQGLVDVCKTRNETLPKLRIFSCGGAGVPPALVYEAKTAFPNCLTWRAMGSTEIPTLTLGPDRPEEMHLAAETDGRICRAEVKVVDAQTGAPLPEGAEGEFLARASNMALGYLHAEDNDAAYDEEGFFRMGDLGRIVAGRYMVVTGRKKDLIIRAGENISAKEIEDVLFEDPRILEAAVVAMPSAKTGEAVCAFIIPAKSAHLDLAALAEIIAKAGLAKQKTPEHVVLVADFPRTASGKVRKDVLREEAKAFVKS